MYKLNCLLLSIFILLVPGFATAISEVMQYVDTSIQPQADFYNHANGKWKQPLDDKRLCASSSNSIATLYYEMLPDCLQGIALNNDEKSEAVPNKSTEDNKKKVNLLYRSLMEGDGALMIKSYLTNIDNTPSKSKIPELVASLNKIDVPVFFNLIVTNNSADKQTLSIILTPDQGVPNLTKEQIGELFTLAGESPPPSDSIEKINLAVLRMASAENDLIKEDGYSTYTTRQLYSSLNSGTDTKKWNEYLTTSGLINKQEISSFFDKSPKIKSLGVQQFSRLEIKLINNFSLDELKAYFKFRFLNTYKTSMHIKPQPNLALKKQIATKQIMDLLGNDIFNLCFKTELDNSREKFDKIFANLKTAYIQGISSLDWMSKKNKALAQQKIQSMTLVVGYVPTLLDYSQISIDGNDPVSNIININKAKYQYLINKLRSKSSPAWWETIKFDIGNYSTHYIPSDNKIVLQPYYALDANFNTNNDALNYGTFGFIIGHEIGHGFFNFSQSLQEQDKVKFTLKTEAVMKQYSSYNTLAEDIPDNTGLAAAYTAYHISLGAKAAPIINRKLYNDQLPDEQLTGYQLFYYAFADIFRGYQCMGDFKYSSITARVNETLKNQPGFYKAFGINPKDIKPTDKSATQPKNMTIFLGNTF